MSIKIAWCLFKLKNKHKKGYCRDGFLGLACSLLVLSVLDAPIYH